jgi:hypothetical protein
MIGGEDFTIPTTAGPAALDMAVRHIRLLWPSAVFENAETGKMFERYSLIPFATSREILAYKNKAIAHKWDELGADESLIGTMVHLLISSQTLTIVVDRDVAGEMKSLVDDIKADIERNLPYGGFGIAA